MIWTEEHDARLVECIKANWSATQVGRLFGISRSAVLGRAYRKGLHFGQKGFWEHNLLLRLQAAYFAKKTWKELAEEFGTTELAVRDALRKLHHRGMVYRPRPSMRGRKTARRSPRLQAPRPVPDHVSFGTVTFRDLTDHHCKWVDGDPAGLDTLYCGQPALADLSYCAEHWRRGHAASVHSD